ncbi:MAG: alpha-2-macroglobulin family protein [Gemmatimonadota bacterium]
MGSPRIPPRRFACAALRVAVALAIPDPTHAQPPLAVQSYAPRGVVRPTGAMTITFDRPVVGTLEHTFDPSRFVRIQPAVRILVEWRDPSTIRVLPVDGLSPGTRYTIVVDTGFEAMDGSRLAAPHRIRLRVRGPVVLGMEPSLQSEWPTQLDPPGHVTIAFSAPLADSVLARAVRLALRGTGPCAGATGIGYHVLRQRAGSPKDDYSLVREAAWNSDSIAERQRRIVEFAPDRALPEGCKGTLSVLSLDSLDGPMINYPVETRRPFVLSSVRCYPDCRLPRGLAIDLSAPVPATDLPPAVHLSPASAFRPAVPAYSTQDWFVPGTIMPGGSYTVTVDSTLRDRFGRRISGPLSRTVSVGDFAVDFGFATGHVYLPPTPTPTIRVRHINVDSIRLYIMPVPDSERVKHMLHPDRTTERPEHPLRDTTVRVVAVHAPRNAIGESDIPLPELRSRYRGQLVVLQASLKRSSLDAMPAGGPGEQPSKDDSRRSLRTARALLQSTALLVYSRTGATGAYVRVTSALDGAPVPNAQVTALDTTGGVRDSARTDAAGVAVLARSTEARFIDVEFEGERSLTDLRDASIEEQQPTVGDTDGSPFRRGRNLHALVFTDRGIYRPGEPMYVSTVIREGIVGQYRRVPPVDSVRFILKRRSDFGQADVIGDTVVRQSALGSAHHTFQLAARSELGDLSVTASVFRDGAWQQAGAAASRLAEYRAPEFLVRAHDDGLEHFRGDTLGIQVRANYLLGAAMADAVVRWQVTFRQMRPGELRIPGLGRDWTVGTGGGWWDEEKMEYPKTHHGRDRIDAAGIARIKVPTDSSPARRPARVNINVTVSDVNRQVVTATASSVVHSASFSLAIRDSSFWWSADTPHPVALIAVRPDGRRVAGVRVRLALVRYHWQPPTADEFGRATGRWRADTVRVDSLTTADSAVTITVPPMSEGALALIATTVDEQSRPVSSSLGRWVCGSGPIPGASPFKLAVRLQRDHLKPGDDVVASFTSPWERADAWITIEREGVFEHRLLQDVHGTVTVRLPVTERDIPNGFVSVSLALRGAVAPGDSAPGFLRIGYAAFRVDDAPKRLVVAITPQRETYAPGDSASFDVSLRDARGGAATGEVTLWATDEGVLSITGFPTPDPMAALVPLTRSGVSVAAAVRMLKPGTPSWLWGSARGEWREGRSRGYPLELTGVAGWTSPPDALSDTVLVRSSFRATAFFRSGIRTDANGNARITVKLPDNVTTFRLMAVAVGAHEQYGSAERALMVFKPLVVRPALPRLVRPGDSLVAGAVINVRDGRPGTVDVVASGTGISLLGDGRRSATLDSRSAEVRFAWRGAASDSARITLRASDGVTADAVRVAIPVAADRVPQARTVAGMIRESVTIRMRLSADLDPMKSTIAIRSGSGPVPTLGAARDFLRGAEYRCSEYLASRGRILVSLLDAQRHGVSVLRDTVEARDELQRLVDELARRAGQIVDCWGAAWILPDLHEASVALMLDARDIGLTIDTALVARFAREYRAMLEKRPVLPDTTYGNRAQRAARIAWHLQRRIGALDVLRRVGTLRASDIRPSLRYADRLTWEDRVSLAELLETVGRHGTAKALLQRLWSSLADVGNRVEFPDSVLSTVGLHSHIRPPARLLRATLAIDPGNPRIGKLVERLTVRTLADRDAWWNTEDHVAAASALARFAHRRRPHDAPMVVQISTKSAGAGRRDTTLTITARGGEMPPVSFAALGAADGAAGLIVTLRTSGGSQFYSITLNEVTRARPVAPVVRGLTVERWYERVDDGRPVTEVEEGELVRVRLKVTAPADREYVVLEDALPAGLEAVDLALKTSSTLGPFSAAASLARGRRRDSETERVSDDDHFGSWVGGWWSPWSNARHHDEHTVFFARKLYRGSSTVSYVVRATTAGRFVRPQAHAAENFNPGLSGRSEGGWFVVRAQTGKP